MTILKTAPRETTKKWTEHPDGRLFITVETGKGRLLLVETGGQVARTRLAQGPGAGIISCRLHDGT